MLKRHLTYAIKKPGSSVEHPSFHKFRWPPKLIHSGDVNNNTLFSHCCLTLRKCDSVSGLTRHISVTKDTPETNTPDIKAATHCYLK